MALDGVEVSKQAGVVVMFNINAHSTTMFNLYVFFLG